RRALVFHPFARRRAAGAGRRREPFHLADVMTSTLALDRVATLEDPARSQPQTLGTVAGMFAGIGGIELGLRDAGFEISTLCDSAPASRAVLAARFPGVEIARDVVDVTPDDVRGVD